MTRAEIRIFAKGFRIATLFVNSDGGWGTIKEMFEKSVNLESNGEKLAAICKDMDCSPVLNVSYIYEIDLSENKLLQFDTIYRKRRDGKLPDVIKGKFLRQYKGGEDDNVE